MVLIKKELIYKKNMSSHQYIYAFKVHSNITRKCKRTIMLWKLVLCSWNVRPDQVRWETCTTPQTGDYNKLFFFSWSDDNIQKRKRKKKTSFILALSSFIYRSSCMKFSLIKVKEKEENKKREYIIVDDTRFFFSFGVLV